MNSDVGIVSSTQANLVHVVEVDYVYLSLLLILRLVLLQVLRLIAVHLERLEHDEVLLRLLYLQQLVLPLVNRVSVLVTSLAELTVDRAPSVRGHMLRDPLVLIATQPLTQAVQVNIAHRAGAFTR